MFAIRFLAALMCLISWVSMAAAANRGYGTAYSKPYRMNATGKNACQFNAKKLAKRWQVYYAALNEADWKKAGVKRGKSKACGRCLKVKGLQRRRGHRQKNVIVKIVDLCPKWACKKGNVDFSTKALKDITGYSWDRKKIQWSFTRCPKK
ncbi:hypothetical protein M9434_003293 [Picochlorum sp. BPE23]|nr:hypothetical protein M9434_003293 [Picochlorum sp. BPE23]